MLASRGPAARLRSGAAASAGPLSWASLLRAAAEELTLGELARSVSWLDQIKSDVASGLNFDQRSSRRSGRFTPRELSWLRQPARGHMFLLGGMDTTARPTVLHARRSCCGWQKLANTLMSNACHRW